MTKNRAISKADHGERGGVIVDSVLIVGTLTLVAIGAINLLGGLMRDDLAANADHRMLAFTVVECPEGWDMVDADRRRESDRRIDVNGDRLVCEKKQRFRPNGFRDNTDSTGR
jgi:hypothetical protein